MDSNKFFVKSCRQVSFEGRGDYEGENGKNGVWNIKRTSGETPELLAFFQGTEKFAIKLSDSYCTEPWKDFWKKDVYFVQFNPASVGTQRFGIGDPGIVKIFNNHYLLIYKMSD